MGQRGKTILSVLFIVASVAVVLVIAFSNTELKDAWGTLGSLSFPWLLGALGCWVAYVMFESLGSWIYLRKQGFHLSFLRSLSSTLVGFYYSNITPGAAGGQPMQVHSLYKHGISVGYASLAITIRLIANQFMVCMISLVLLLLNRSFVLQQLEGMIWVVRVGWLINFAVVPLVLLAAFQRRWMQALAEKLIRFLARLHLVKQPDRLIEQVSHTLDTYHSALGELRTKAGQILIQLLCSLVSLLGLFASVVFIYHAFGLSGTPWWRILTLSSLLFVSVSYTPLPGASGAQEGGFLLYFKGIFTEGTIGLALLVWRFLTFYLFVLVGMVAMVAERIINRRRKTKTGSEDPAETPQDS